MAVAERSGRSVGRRPRRRGLAGGRPWCWPSPRGFG